MRGEAFGDAEQSETAVRVVVARPRTRQPVDLNVGRFASGRQLAVSAQMKLIEYGRHLSLFVRHYKTLLAQTEIVPMSGIRHLRRLPPWRSLLSHVRDRARSLYFRVERCSREGPKGAVDILRRD
jgi:hypothetical protein